MKASDENSPTYSYKSEKKVIEKIKAEIENLFSEFKSNNGINLNEDFLYSLTKLHELIKFSMQEVEDMEALNLHFEELRREKDGYKMQAKRLTEENKWLREELNNTTEKLQKREMEYIDLETNKKTLDFLLELNSNQNIENNQSKNAQTSEATNMNENKFNPANMTGSIINSISLNNSTLVIEQPSMSDTQPRYNQAMPYNLPVHEVPPRLKTLHQLVIQYATQGRYEIAIPLCKQTLQDLEQSSGHYHPDVATMLNILALVYRDKGDLEEAVTALTEALEIRKKTLGLDSPKVAATLNNLSVLYAKQGNHIDAEPLCRDALKIRESILGPSHPDVAKQLNNLALLCHNQGKYDEVEKLYTRALNIYLGTYPSTDHNVIKTKNNLASSYIKQGKFREAERILKDLLNNAWDNQWIGREKDIKSKPIWIIAEERERFKNLSMSTSNLSQGFGADKQLSTLSEQNGEVSHPPFGFDMKNRSKEDKMALLTSLKFLASLYNRDNKPTASSIIEEWLEWAGRPFSNYEKDVRMLSYESSLIHNDIYNSSQSSEEVKTLWYTSPSPISSNYGRPRSRLSSNLKRSSNTSCLHLDSNRDGLNASNPHLLTLSDYASHDKSSNTLKLPTHLSPYLYKTPLPVCDQKSKYESEKGHVYDNSGKY